jgi:hypothetical protein
VTLHATASDTIYWFSAASGGSSLATGTSFTTPNISTTTTYYAQASLACPSSRVPVNAVISSQAADPVTTDGSRCGNGSVTVSATSPDPITWYDAPSGGSVVGTGASLATPAISTTTTYYAIAGITGCLSNPVAAVATVNPVPAAPTVTGASNCGPGSLTLTANASNPMSWYAAASGGSALTTGGTYSSTFNVTTTVYVESNDGTCPSNRVGVTATIYTSPVVNLGPPAVTIIQGQTITLDAGAGFSSYSWSTGASTQTITVGVDGTFSVTVTDAHNCTGTDNIVVNVTPNAVEDSPLSTAIGIYPNPSKGNFNIKVSDNNIHFTLHITDAVGQILIMDRHDDKSIFDRNYDLSRYASGVYFLRIISEEGTATRSLIIQ